MDWPTISQSPKIGQVVAIVGTHPLDYTYQHHICFWLRYAKISPFYSSFLFWHELEYTSTMTGHFQNLGDQTTQQVWQGKEGAWFPSTPATYYTAFLLEAIHITLTTHFPLVILLPSQSGTWMKIKVLSAPSREWRQLKLTMKVLPKDMLPKLGSGIPSMTKNN